MVGWGCFGSLARRVGVGGVLPEAGRSERIPLGAGRTEGARWDCDRFVRGMRGAVFSGGSVMEALPELLGRSAVAWTAVTVGGMFSFLIGERCRMAFDRSGLLGEVSGVDAVFRLIRGLSSGLRNDGVPPQKGLVFGNGSPEISERELVRFGLLTDDFALITDSFTVSSWSQERPVPGRDPD